MSAVPVYSASPIKPNAAKAEGVTPSTAAARYTPSDLPKEDVAATPTTPARLSTTNYPSAQPEAHPAPPTATATMTSQVASTPTRAFPVSSTQASDLPPPPQPGALPSPFIAPTGTTGRRPSIPPPPKAGELPKPASYYTSQPESSSPPKSTYVEPPALPLHQRQPSMQTPTRAQPPASETMIPGPHDLSHPPGYIQDTHASFAERPVDAYSPFNNQSNHKKTPSRNLGGILDSSPSNVGQEEDKSLWGTAVSWAKTVGEKVVEGEESIWKAINKKE